MLSAKYLEIEKKKERVCQLVNKCKNTDILHNN